MAIQPTIDELVITDPPAPWRAAGFDVKDDRSLVGSVRLRFVGRGERRGIVEWSVRDASSLDLDGLPTSASEGPPVSGAAHANGVVSIDHVVVMTPDLDRTVVALRAAGVDFRRLREGDTPGGSVRQGFFRMGEVILEVVQAPEGTKMAADPSGPARLWGISFLVRDLQTTSDAIGDNLSTPRDAVQPGRRIATVRRGAGLGPAIAFMTPGPGAI